MKVGDLVWYYPHTTQDKTYRFAYRVVGLAAFKVVLGKGETERWPVDRYLVSPMTPDEEMIFRLEQ